MFRRLFRVVPLAIKEDPYDFNRRSVQVSQSMGCLKEIAQKLIVEAVDKGDPYANELGNFQREIQETVDRYSIYITKG